MRVHRTDIEYLPLIRDHIGKVLRRAADMYDGPEVTVLEIGPGEYDGARKAFKQATVKTLDIDPDSGADYITSISLPIPAFLGFGLIVCTDVLEHVRDPFMAIKNIAGMLDPEGPKILVLSTPLNYRIHGMGGYSPDQGTPPDYWRFTEHGLRLLLSEFEILEFDSLESDRGLFPIHYTVIARKK